MSLESYCTNISELFHAYSLYGGELGENPFLRNFMMKRSAFVCTIFRFYKVVSVRNLTISVILGNSYPISCNFNF